MRDLGDFLAAVRTFGISGFSVTLPHKQRILRYLDECDPLAAEIGAVNTVVVRGGDRLYGYNTDYVGVLRAIEQRVPLARQPRAAGGRGRSGARGRFCAGAQRSRGGDLGAAPGAGAGAGTRRRAAKPSTRRALRREFFDAIVNCTPVGMHPGGGSPLTARELNAAW